MQHKCCKGSDRGVKQSDIRADPLLHPLDIVEFCLFAWFFVHSPTYCFFEIFNKFVNFMWGLWICFQKSARHFTCRKPVIKVDYEPEASSK